MAGLRSIRLRARAAISGCAMERFAGPLGGLQSVPGARLDQCAGREAKHSVLDRKLSADDPRGIGRGLSQAPGTPSGSDPGENLMPWASGSSFDQLMVTV